MKSQDFDDDDMPKLSIKQENEFKKMKLKLEHDAIFPDTKQFNLPPEIEGMFLDSIFNFEKAFRNAKKVTVFEKIGSPKFKLAEDLTDEKLDKALSKITKLMKKNNMVLDVICDYDNEERLIYKFITEELFLHQIDDFDIPGMNTCFIYEEFHPNHKFYLENNTIDYLDVFFDKKSELYYSNLEKQPKNHLELNNFRSLFEKFKIKKLEIKNIKINKKSAKTTFDIDFWGKISGNNSKINYSGEGSISYKKTNDFWTINELNLPINN